MADGGSTDSTREIVSRFPLKHPQVIPGKIQQLPAQGAMGFRHGRGDIHSGDGHCRIGNWRLFGCGLLQKSGRLPCRPQPLDPPAVSIPAGGLVENPRLGHGGGSYILDLRIAQSHRAIHQKGL